MIHCVISNRYVDESCTGDHASGNRLQCVGSGSIVGWCMTSRSGSQLGP